MKTKKPILLVLGEPNSVFVEILSRVIKKKNLTNRLNCPIIIIGSKEIILKQLKFLKKKLLFQSINKDYIENNKLQNKLYLIDIKYRHKKIFEKISNKSKKYISKCFDEAFYFLNHGLSDIIINGPVSKKHFLNKKYPGVTEYLFDRSLKKVSKKPVMLLYNKKLSVSPVTTHIPIKNVTKNINKKNILKNAKAINAFYKKFLKRKPKIAVLGLNPHCESTSVSNEDINIIMPAIKALKKENINVSGPYPADTFFLKKNIRNYDSVIGMYHDQVLTPFKTLFNFDASNITLNLPFLRLSVDHGPNEYMMGQNKSNTESLKNIISFINLIK